MIVYRQWDAIGIVGEAYICDGWFLFGVIPIYTRRRFNA